MNAPTQPVPQVMPWLPPKIAAALAAARTTYRAAPLGKSGKNEDDPENAYTYFRADDVVEAGEKVLASAGLTVLFASAELGCLPARNGTLVVRRFAWLCHRDGEVMAMGLQSWPLPDRGDMSMAMSTAMTMSTARIYRELLAMTGVGAAQEESDAPQKPVSKPAGRTPKARHIGALARASGQTVPEDVSEKDEREARDELARVEAEKKANADPRWKDEKPLADPPGLMEDEPAVPPDPVTIQKADSAGLSQPVDTATPSSAVLGGDLNRSGDTPQTRTEIPAPPASGTSSEAGNSNDGPNFLDQGEWAGVKSESSAGGESLPTSSSSPPAPGPQDGGSLLQPSPALLEAVDGLLSKASGVLAKRSADGRAGKWAKSVERAARKDCLCVKCHGAIKKGDQHQDGGSKGRMCLTCFGRLNQEAA